MTDPPAGFADDADRLAWLRRAYYGLDGRWYLKVRDRLGPTTAQEIDEAVCRSLGRLHLTTWLELTGRSTVEDCAVLGRFVLDVFDTLYGDWRDAFDITASTPDRFEIRHRRCVIFDMGAAAAFTDGPARPGELPGCAGIRELFRGWVDAAGRYTVSQKPSQDETGRPSCRYTFSLRSGD